MIAKKQRKDNHGNNSYYDVYNSAFLSNISVSNVISSVSHFIAASRGPNFRHFSPGHPIQCAVISSFIYFPWNIREERERERRGVTIQPSKSREPQLSLGIVAEMRKMTAGILKKPRVNDDDEPSVSGEVTQWTPQHPRAPRNSARHVQEPY